MPLACSSSMLVPSCVRDRMNLRKAVRLEQLDIAENTSNWCSYLRESREFTLGMMRVHAMRGN
jgi:hypothetical protein